MKNRPGLLVVGALTAMLLAASPARAQSSATTLVPRGDVFSGVAFFNEDMTSLCGFHVTATWRPGAHVGIVGDLTVYGDSTDAMGGVRIQGTGRHSLYVQVLAGTAPLDAFAIQPGVGFDFRVSRRFAVRTGFDVKISGDEGGMFIGSRFSMGVVYLFGQQ